MTDAQLIDVWRGHLESERPGFTWPIPLTRFRSSSGRPTLGRPRLVIRSVAKPTKPTLSNIVSRRAIRGSRSQVEPSLHPAGPEVRRGVPATGRRRARSVGWFAKRDDGTGPCGRRHRRVAPSSQGPPNGLLSMEELRGLVGELWLLSQRVQRKDDQSRLRSRAGSDRWVCHRTSGTPRMAFTRPRRSGRRPTRVRISSEHQLDTDHLELVVLAYGEHRRADSRCREPADNLSTAFGQRLSEDAASRRRT